MPDKLGSAVSRKLKLTPNKETNLHKIIPRGLKKYETRNKWGGGLTKMAE